MNMQSEAIGSFQGTLIESTEPVVDTAQSELEKSATWKLDLLLIPTLGIFFFLSFLDRSNLGNVRVIGLEEDLHMTDHDYSMALTVTFIPYILVEFPSNLVLRKIGAGIYIPSLVAVWGLVTCLQGLVTNLKGLLVARFFLGFVEGGLYPGILLYLSKFYTRTNIQLRITMFWSTICLSGAMSGLLTFAIMRMDGYLNRKGWSWVFIIEGFFSSVFGILGFFVLPSTLEKAKLLTAAERSAIAARLKRENFNDLSWAKTATGKPLAKPISFQAWQAMKSPHVLLVSTAKFMEGANVYSLAYFIPTIVKSFGHSRSGTQLLTIPIYVVTFCYIVPMSYLADRYQTRGIATCVSALLALTGFTIFYVSADKTVRYASLFISLSGAYGCSPCLGAWLTNNSEPYARKEFTLGVGPAIGNLGGLAAVWFFAHAHKPRYAFPTMLSIIFSVGIFLCTVLNIIWLAYAQRVKVTKREDILARFMSRKEEAEPKRDASEDVCHTTGGLTIPQLRAAQAWDELGDKHPDFKYSL